MLFRSDALDALKTLESDSIHSLITDPPAGISFMGKDWDSGNNFIPAMTEIFAECLRVLKPGAHGLVWALPRTSHWTATALEQAGFEVRDVITHLFGSGFPKSLNIAKAAQKLGLEGLHDYDLSGWGTALKPAAEFWWLVRKPISEKTVAKNVLKWGVGGINIDGCRVGTETITQHKRDFSNIHGNKYGPGVTQPVLGETSQTIGRFPANLVLDETAAEMLDEQSGLCKSGGASSGRGFQEEYIGGKVVKPVLEKYSKDKGQGASRFFKCFSGTDNDE